jgi:hypothetical protein
MERSISSIGGIFLFYKFIQNIFTISRPPLCGGGNHPFNSFAIRPGKMAFCPRKKERDCRKRPAKGPFADSLRMA